MFLQPDKLLVSPQFPLALLGAGIPKHMQTPMCLQPWEQDTSPTMCII